MPSMKIRKLLFGTNPENVHYASFHQSPSFASPRSPCSNRGRSSTVPPSPSRQTFSATLMGENVSSAESIIARWDPSTNPEASMTSLFRSHPSDARLLLHAIADLHRAMIFFASDDLAGDSLYRSQSLIHYQSLMQSGVRRLELELHLLLSSSPETLDSAASNSSEPEASSDEEKNPSDASISPTSPSSAAADLREIADAMISAGYGKELLRIYKTSRKSIVDEGLHRLGFEKLSPSQIQKLDWEVLDLKILSWLRAAPPAFKTLIAAERALADHVFAVHDSIRESCFAEIARDAAAALLAFPESVAKTKTSPEKVFRLLDLHDTISELWPEIDSLFSSSSDSAAPIRNQALTSLLKLAEVARNTIAEFEAAIQKDQCRSPVPGAGVHPITRYVMNYLVFLSDYEAALADIFADFPLDIHRQFSDPLATEVISGAGETPRSSVSTSFAWLLLVLLCKLDGKAEAYKEVAQSYLFLANNLHYMITKITASGLKEILGEDWVEKHKAKSRHYLDKYEKLGWAKVAASIPAAGVKTAAEATERMRGFNSAFEEACALQSQWWVVDQAAREEVRASVVRMLVPAYRGFYWRCRELLGGTAAAMVVRYSPEDVRNRLVELFSAPATPGFGSASRSGSGSGSGSGSSKFCWRGA